MTTRLPGCCVFLGFFFFFGKWLSGGWNRALETHRFKLRPRSGGGSGGREEPGSEVCMCMCKCETQKCVSACVHMFLCVRDEDSGSRRRSTEAQEVTDVSGESAHSAFPREGG